MTSRPLGIIRETGNKKLDSKLLDLENYDFSRITKSCIDRYKWSISKAEKFELEAKRFFSLAFLDSGFYHIPEPDVDEYWHRMILHTQWYSRFCSDIFGEYYHHTPEPDPELVNAENRNRSLGLVEHWFGYRWESLVETCTQCKGPFLRIENQDLQPSSDARFKG